MIGTIVYQLTRNLSPAEIKAGGFEDYFVDHTTGVYSQGASGMPWSAASMQSKGDLIADLVEDMAADAATSQAQPGLSGKEGRNVQDFNCRGRPGHIGRH